MQKDFSYPLLIDDLSSSESKYQIKADKGELLFLKDLLKVEDMHSLSVEFKVKLDRKRHILNVNGHLNSKVELKSVISLEVFSKEYGSDFSLIYDTNPSYDFKEDEELDFDDEIVENVYEGKIDLAQIAIEQLALLIDDYPRKDGESFSFKSEFSEEDKKNPFDILAELKK
ncbi:MAG: DUF177 domain-containing protein [Lactobacillaceae bacterium]|jgi:uncharacterized metal-binding protein YceD (DUF177 family)|nr:DUF177 domain-containing protein [Lactobacillaceae bacterium]